MSGTDKSGKPIVSLRRDFGVTDLLPLEEHGLVDGRNLTGGDA